MQSWPHLDSDISTHFKYGDICQLTLRVVDLAAVNLDLKELWHRCVKRIYQSKQRLKMMNAGYIYIDLFLSHLLCWTNSTSMRVYISADSDHEAGDKLHPHGYKYRSGGVNALIKHRTAEKSSLVNKLIPLQCFYNEMRKVIWKTWQSRAVTLVGPNQACKCSERTLQASHSPAAAAAAAHRLHHS